MRRGGQPVPASAWSRCRRHAGHRCSPRALGNGYTGSRCSTRCGLTWAWTRPPPGAGRRWPRAGQPSCGQPRDVVRLPTSDLRGRTASPGNRRSTGRPARGACIASGRDVLALDAKPSRRGALVVAGDTGARWPVWPSPGGCRGRKHDMSQIAANFARAGTSGSRSVPSSWRSRSHGTLGARGFNWPAMLGPPRTWSASKKPRLPASRGRKGPWRPPGPGPVWRAGNALR